MDQSQNVMRGHYILNDDHEAVEVDDIIQWARAFESSVRRVAQDTISGVRISTVFLGLDHGWGSTPQLFETMIFGGEYDEHQVRYETWDEAVTGHKAALEMVQAT
jgi:hypothetical protein